MGNAQSLLCAHRTIPACIRDIRSLNRRGLQPIYIGNGQVAVVNSQHLGPKHVDYNGLEKTSTKEFEAAPEAHIHKDDLLIYTTLAHISGEPTSI